MNQSAVINKDNVVSFSVNTVYSDIQSHLRDASLSDNTRTAYETDLRQFFIWARNGKRLEDLTVDDLIFKNNKIKDYQKFLTIENKNSTITRKLKSIVSLYMSLKQNDYDVNVDAMRVKNLTNDSKKHGFLTFEETERMADQVLNYTDGKEKRALIKLAVRSSLRKIDLLNLTFDMIFENGDKIYIESVEKKTGERSKKNISKEMYNLLLNIKSDKYNDNKIFHLTLRQIETMMLHLHRDLGIDPRRGVTFHSYRKAGAGYVYELTGDIMAAADQLGNKNVNTSRDFYVEGNGNIAGLAMDEKIDENVFDELSRDEMLELLKSVGNGQGLMLRRKSKAIIDGRG